MPGTGEFDRIHEWLNRSGGRRDVDFAALIDRTDGSRHCGRITNLSYDGCQIVADARLAVGEKVLLLVPAFGEIRAEVRWVTDDSAGALFLTDQSAPSRRRPDDAPDRAGQGG